MAEVILEKPHFFYSPHKILFGLNTVKVLGNEAKQLGGQKAFIVTDPGVIKAGLLSPVKESLESAEIPYVIYDQVEPEPPIRCVEMATKQFKSEKCNLVVGVGGGSSLDVAKGVSILATNEGRLLDLCGIDLVKKEGAKKILIPTTSGTGSEATRVFVITDEKENAKKVVYSSYTLSDIAIVDPLLSLTLPPQVTAETGMDALVHLIEAYVSMNATPFSDMMAEKSIPWITRYLPMAWAKGSNLEARYFMSLAGTMGGMAFASGGLGAVHALAYAIGTEYHLPHGRSNAIMLPHVMQYNLSGHADKYVAIASLMGKNIQGLSTLEAARWSVKAVEELLTTLQISFHLRDYGIPREGIPKLVEGGMKSSRLFIPNPRDLNEEDVRHVFEAAY
jgi:alcohol dehydrogenase class IV